MRIYLLYIALIVAIHQNGCSEVESLKMKQELERMCESYTFMIVKPLLDHFQKIDDELVKSNIKDKEIADLKEKLIELEQRHRIESAANDKEKEQQVSLCQSEIKEKYNYEQKEIVINETIKDLRSQVNMQQKTIESLLIELKSVKNFDQLQKELAYKSGEFKVCESQLSTVNVSYTKQSEEMKGHNDNFNTQLKEHQKKQLQTLENLQLCQNEVLRLNETKHKSCISFRHSIGVQRIAITGLGTIDVLCNSQIVKDGDGWMVIQQRIDGKTDFFRNWTTYRNGFGSFDGDFFLGLEKLHHLTMGQQQELYIHMKSFNGEVNFARYDDFTVGGEEEGYKLLSLGKFSSSNLHDMIRWHETMKFSTFDRENDNYQDGNCAVDYHGAWWDNACAASNLNGEYSDVEQTGHSSMYWADYVALKEVRMLIRPKVL